MSMAAMLASMCLDNKALAQMFGPKKVSSVKQVLWAIANHADADHVAFPSNAMISLLSGLSERTVRDLLPEIADARLIRRELRTRKDGSHSSPLTTLLFMKSGPFDPKALKATGLKDMMSAVVAESDGAITAPPPANPVSEVGRSLPQGGAITAPLTSFEPPTEPLEGNTHSQDAGASAAPEGEGAPDGADSKEGREGGFEALCALWASSVVRGRNSRLLSWDAWLTLTPEERAALPAAMARYAERKPWGSAGPPALHRWMTEGFWRDFVGVEPSPPPEKAKTSADRAVWCGDPEVRAAVVAAEGEAFARAYIDPSTQAGVTILTRTNMAADRLRQSKVLAGLGLTVAVATRGAG